MPNKHTNATGQFFEGHLLSSQTYVGGHVEALEAGVFRSDLPTRFKLSSDACQRLIDEIDHALQFSITVEHHTPLDQVENYELIKRQIVDALEALRDNPNRVEKPSIYHLDVAAMYPNIILTNRLQPDAVVNEDVCATCDFNEGPGSKCQRVMPWSWRGEFFTAKRGEYNLLRNQLEQEKFPVKGKEGAFQSFHDMSRQEQTVVVNKRVGEYSRKVYGKIHETRIVEKESIVCQRENPFYVNTVRDFRDRRYEYKALLKQWKKKCDEAMSAGDLTAVDEAQKLVVIYDSLQVAHKCILNSFYGYVMRKGARWYSMEMAGIVCLTGAKIIQLARSRIEQLGRPLELDTDGIWCMLPGTFPENFSFTLKNGKSLAISYPCVMLNHLVHDQFTNDQYQELVDPATSTYSIRKENSIFFEVDGPYRAMILPSSTEEDKLLKKRYAVFNFDGSLAELKGFEVKRRGELKLVKNYQSSIFKVFLEGETLEDCYKAVADASNRWLDILHTKGANLSDSELFDLVSENRSMSKSLQEYGSQKSTSISTAKRLAEFLGDQMVQDKGLNCKFVIASKPNGLPVSERAIPVAIFQSEPAVKKHFLRKWLKDTSLNDPNIRDVIDWNYYLERFGSVIQKLVTIPAAMQNVENPIPRVKHPDWLLKRLMNRDDKNKQFRITEMFGAADAAFTAEQAIEALPKGEAPAPDIEDMAQRRPPPVYYDGKRRINTALVKRGKSKKSNDLSKFRKLPPGVNPFEDYVGWIEQQREVWKDLLRRRPTAYQAPAGSGIQSFFTASTHNIRQSVWQILNVAETDTPGIFRVWFVIDGNMTSMLFEVPRIIYINSRLSDGYGAISRSEIQMAPRVRNLPRNRPMHNLYELRMTESFYRDNSSLFSSIFNHKDVEGVYETQVSLLFRALLNIGCFGQLRRLDSITDLPSVLELEDLTHVQKPTSLYLRDDAFQALHLFRGKTGSRQMLGLFAPHNATIITVLVDPALNREAIPGTKRHYVEAWKAKYGDEITEDEEYDYPHSVEVKSLVVASEKEAIQALNSELQAIKDEGSKPIVLGLQVPGGEKHLRSMGLTAVREFPCMQIPCHKADSLLPALGWQSYVSKRMVGHFLNLKDFLAERIELCRYADIPLCNIENDYTLFLSDLFLSRRLVKQDMILWCSSSSKPDLGGSEQDDNRFSLDELKYPEINNAGTYESICIEIDVWDLALNTLIQSFEQQAELESGGRNNYLLNDHFHNSAESSSLGITGSGDSLVYSLGAIKSMVKGWLDEVRKQNKFASHLLEHFHRWITSSNAYLYDPLIVSHMHNLMKQMFSNLIEDVQRLGSEVVYASFDKLVLSTTKKTMKTGVGYVTYLLTAISKNDIFRHLELKPVNFWGYLCWMNTQNHGGILFVDPNAEQPIDMDGVPVVDQNAIVDMHWSIADYLPPAVQNAFLEVVAEYLHRLQEFKSDPSVNFHESLAKVLETDIADHMYQIVTDIQKRKLSDDPQDISEFPSLPGSCRKMTNPSLEFIKMIMAVFSLDKNLSRTVRVVKSNLLKLIAVKEFSPDAIFKWPSEKYVLSQVICEYCNYCCDLDLTQQNDMMQSEDDESVGFLTCHGCSTPYDKESIEQRLMENAQILVCKWQLQDLKCSLCRLVKAEELRETCASCTGPMTTILDRNACVQQLRVLTNLSEFFKMDALREIIQFII